MTYELRYGCKYVPIVLKFLAAVARKYLRKLWVTSTFRAIMTDEVKVADSQWLSTAARFYLGDQCINVPTGCGVLPADDRDAKASGNALGDPFMKSAIHPWLDAAVVAITVDGASVLLSGLCDRLQQQAPHTLFWYCAAHRTKRVDFDVTEVPKAERGEHDADVVRKGAKRLNNIWSRTAKFFNVSTRCKSEEIAEVSPPAENTKKTRAPCLPNSMSNGHSQAVFELQIVFMPGHMQHPL